MYNEITLMTKLSEENSDLKKIIKLMKDVTISDNKIIKLQRENIEHLKMIANDRQVMINQMNEKAWSVRKLDEDRVGNIPRNFIEDYMNDMDCGDPHWPDSTVW